MHSVLSAISLLIKYENKFEICNLFDFKVYRIKRMISSMFFDKGESLLYGCYTAVLHACTVFTVTEEKLTNVAIGGWFISPEELRSTRFYARYLLTCHTT